MPTAGHTAPTFYGRMRPTPLTSGSCSMGSVLYLARLTGGISPGLSAINITFGCRLSVKITTIGQRPSSRLSDGLQKRAVSSEVEKLNPPFNERSRRLGEL